MYNCLLYLQGRSILANCEVERETDEMMNMIHSVMPKKVAEILMTKEKEAQEKGVGI